VCVCVCVLAMFFGGFDAPRKRAQRTQHSECLEECMYVRMYTHIEFM
jgi:hypothetical protein